MERIKEKVTCIYSLNCVTRTNLEAEVITKHGQVRSMCGMGADMEPLAYPYNTTLRSISGPGNELIRLVGGTSGGF